MDNFDHVVFTVLDENFDSMFEPDPNLPKGDFDKNWDEEVDMENWRLDY